MSKMKRIVMVMMIVFVSCLLVAMTFEVKATGDGNPIDISGNLDLTLDGENSDVLPTEPDLNTTMNEPIQNAEQNSEIIQPDTNTTATNTLPKTGVTEDITVIFFIVVCVVSAIYAYKKIRDYRS